MSRGDIANYLRLASETVSRVLTRFRSQRLIALEGRDVELRDVAGLRRIGESLLPD
jgi:CRP/FNR family transcriptional regulator